MDYSKDMYGYYFATTWPGNNGFIRRTRGAAGRFGITSTVNLTHRSSASFRECKSDVGFYFMCQVGKMYLRWRMIVRSLHAPT